MTATSASSRLRGLTQLGRTQTIVVAIVACLAVLAGGWFLLIKPKRDAVAATKAQADSQVTTNNGLRLQIASLRDLSRQLPAKQAELDQLTQRVPDQVQLPTLLRQIEDAAKQTGVQFNGIVPQPPTAVPGATGVQAVNLTVTVDGHYAAIEQFDNALETLSRAFLVSGFSLSQGKSSDPSELTATINGQVLVRGAGGVLPGSPPVRS